MTTYDFDDAPPHDDADYRAPGVPSPDATALAIALNRIAAALERLSISPGGAQASAPPPPSGAPSAPPGGQVNDSGVKTLQQRRGGLIFYACRDHGFAGKAAEVGQRVTGRPMDKDSRLWAEADQVAVLGAMKSWGWT